ncbi:exodeoxyribonuclease V subunit alpha [Thalassolituus marinus]|uniref:RecBCD enzyme subunit RecD n=1 Tax=Thalassolituus marinus TaxID=671053 RepID=A0ABS7ZRF0_9GAMM|nr:exodeoxyribonuclease V subunit alpha [Thalassolituus marinus]MCA6062975.1 exodeoxyribonuclease V subunit alpha [Thalassolituus marinus]
MNPLLLQYLPDIEVKNLRDIDRQVASQVLQWEVQAAADTEPQTLLCLAVASVMVSVALGKGQVCLPLTSCALPEWREFWQEHSLLASSQLADCRTVYVADAKLKTAVGDFHDYAQQPLVLHGNNLYLARYFFYERGVLTQIHQRLALQPELNDAELSHTLMQLFGEPAAVNSDADSTAVIDWQKVAAASACSRNFAVITGGPGTGKTTTVTRLLSALLSQNPQMSIALAAPTGKAAARMTESIRGAKLRAQQSSETSLPFAEQIPDDSFTLHRLLGWSPRGFRYNANRHLPFDCVVVDEASMVDLPMMYHLFQALAADTRLILLGDRDQLASVEAGSVLADLCDAGVQHGPDAGFAQRLQQLTGFDLASVTEEPVSPMQNAVASLRVSHRFTADSGIGQLAAAVNNSAQQRADEVLRTFEDVRFVGVSPLAEQPFWQQSQWQQTLVDGYRDYAEALRAFAANKADANDVFSAFNRFQILVALRQGPYGVEQVNQRAERLLQAAGLIDTRASASGWYAGRPVMISRNEYDLGLFNGDIGIALPVTDEQGKPTLKVAFPDADGGVRYLLPSRLPAHETAFAMTVHKSQGSEFDHLCLLLPEQWQSVITRELIYTAITRAKKTFTLFSGHNCWQQGLATRVQRASGLRDALWQ